MSTSRPVAGQITGINISIILKRGPETGIPFVRGILFQSGRVLFQSGRASCFVGAIFVFPVLVLMLACTLGLGH